MKKGTIFISPLGTRKRRETVFQHITSHRPDHDYSSILYITPAVFTQREVIRQFYAYLKNTCKKKAYIPFQSFTLNSLCRNLYEVYGTESVISEQVGMLVFCEILGEKNVGHARFLLDLLSKIRHYIPDEELSYIRKDITSHIFEERTTERTQRAFEALDHYDITLHEKGQVDFGKALLMSIPLIQKHVKIDTLVVDGFFDPTPLELRIVNTLTEQSETTYVLVEESAEFLRLLTPEMDKFDTVKLTPVSRRKSSGYYPYPSVEGEVEGIARGVKGCILEGVKTSEIVISFPAPEKYAPMVKRIFRKHGIPVNIIDYDLSNLKPVTVLQELITSIQDDYPLNEFLSILTSPHFPALPGIIKEWSVSLSHKAGIVKGKHAWLSIKETLLNSSEEQILPDRKSLYEEFQKQMGQVIQRLEEIKRQNNLISFVDAFESVLNKFGYFESLKEFFADSPGERMTQSIEMVLRELRHFAEFSGSQKITIDDAGFFLKQLLKGIRGSLDQRNGVRIVPFELAAGLEPKALFCGGAVEGDLPSKPPIDPILPEQVKKAVGLPHLEYYLNRQERYFRRLLHTSRDDPFFSYPEADGDKIFLPSPFLDWGKRLSLPVYNISTEEEILMRQGSREKRDFSTVMWSGDFFLTENMRKMLVQRVNKKTYFRVTDIDAYRQCPLRYYIDKFLCIEREEPPRFEIEARLWGRIAHTAMEFLYKDGDIPIDTIDRRLFLGLEKGLKESSLGDFWAAVARRIFQKLLPALKKQETDLRIQGFSPCLVEKGMKVLVDGLGLKGKVDRVDIKKAQIPNSPERLHSDNFQKDEQKIVILLDYKTGSPDRDSLQLPLYACMWEKAHHDQVEKTGYYLLRTGSVDWFPKRSGMKEFMQDSLKRAECIVEKIRKGDFAPSPAREGTCRYCYHNPLCSGAKQ